jgi:HD superfamily phosphohydrolase
MQVYQHHTRLIADRMFLRALELAIFSEKKIPETDFQFYGREKEFLTRYLNLDDYTIYNMILTECRGGSSPAYAIIDDLRNRRLFKRAYTKDFNEISPIKRMSIWKKAESELEQQLSSDAGVPAELVIVHKDSEEGGLKSYRTFGRVTEANEIPIIYIDKNGEPKPYDDRSPISLRKDPSEIIYVFTRKDLKDKLASVCDKVLG